MVYQSDEKLNIPASDELCYLFAVLYGHETFGKHAFTHIQVKVIYDLLVDQEYIREDGFLKKDAVKGIAQIASHIAKNHVYMRKVEEGEDFNFLVARFSRVTNGGKSVYHFAPVSLVDKETVIYDPWSPWGSKTCKEGKIDGYRYIFGEMI